MTSYQEEQRLKQEFLSLTATGVAKFLEGKWTLDSEKMTLNGPGERAIDFGLPWNNDSRIIISGCWINDLSQHLPYKREKTEITVSKEKTHEQIARDITRRLLPDYERVLEKTIYFRAKHLEYQSQKNAAMEKIKIAIGGDADIREGQIFGYEPYSFQAKYHSDGEISLEITLPVEKAVKLLEQI